MKLRANPFYRRAHQALLKNLSWQKPWSGFVFRSVRLEFAHPEMIVDGKGAMKSGGRWNRPGLGPVLYCSLQPGAAAEESMRLFEAAGFKRSAVKPRLIVGIRYQLSSVIDLPDLISAIPGVELAELMAEEWQKINQQGRETQGQALGRAIFNARVEAFRAPSARIRDAVNLVIFPQNLRPTSRQQVLEKQELQTWLKR